MSSSLQQKLDLSDYKYVPVVFWPHRFKLYPIDGLHKKQKVTNAVKQVEIFSTWSTEEMITFEWKDLGKFVQSASWYRAGFKSKTRLIVSVYFRIHEQFELEKDIVRKHQRIVFGLN